MNIIKSFLVAVVIGIGLVAVAPLTAGAAAPSTPQAQLCKGSGGTWNGTECLNSKANGSLPNFFRTIVNILLFVIGAVSVIMIIIGGVKYMVSGGDSSQVTAAKNTILYAIIGLVIAILAYAIVDFVATGLTTP